MLANLRARLTYANVVATLAFFLALSTGGAYAANTIFSEDIVDGQVKTPDVANGAVITDKLAGGAVTSDKVKDDGLGGRDVLDNTLKGVDIDESTLTNIGGGGPAGGDLAGSYPNPEIAADAVGESEIAPDAVGFSELNPLAFAQGDIVAGTSRFEIAFEAIQRDELGFNSVASRALTILQERRGATVTADGGDSANGDWGSGTATATCLPGEDLLFGYGEWTTNSPGEELAITELDLDHVGRRATVTGISDSGAEQLRAVAVCAPD
jgi:hypothetical protein